MNSQLVLLNLIFTPFFIFILTFVANFLGLIDRPSLLKKHKSDAYLIGGISIFLSLIIFTLFFNEHRIITYIILTSSIIVLIGLLDDIYNLPIILRFFFQIISSLIIIGFGVVLHDFGLIFNNYYLSFGIFSILITVLAIVGLINAFNFIDGIDGLASLLFLIAFSSLIIYFYLLNDSFNIPYLEFIIAIVIFVFCTFIFNNFNIVGKKVFLGDAGSTLLGFILVCFLIILSQEPNRVFDPALLIWSVTLPIFDLFRIVLLRILSKNNPFKPDKNHLHYILSEKNFSNNTILLILASISLFFILIGFLIYKHLGSTFSFLLYFVFFIIYLKYTQNLKKI